MLEGKYVKLRALEESDLKNLRNWRNSKEIRRAVREFRLLNMVSQKKWLETTHSENPPKSIMFGIMNKKNSLIGVCGLTYIDWKNRQAEISCYLILKNWQKTKEAKDVILILLKYGFEELNLHKIWGEVFAIANENKKLLEKMKFVLEGTLRDKLWREGKWWNSYIYSIISSEYLKHKNDYEK